MRDRLIELLKKGQADHSRRSLENIKKILYEKHKYNSKTDKVLSLWEELADYLLADGWIRPPCKVGDVVYQTDGVRIYESTINKIIYCTESIAFDDMAIGKSIFLTPAAVEQALKGGAVE